MKAAAREIYRRLRARVVHQRRQLAELQRRYDERWDAYAALAAENRKLEARLALALNMKEKLP